MPTPSPYDYFCEIQCRYLNYSLQNMASASVLPPVNEALSLLDVSFVNNEWQVDPRSTRLIWRQPITEVACFVGTEHPQPYEEAFRYWWTTYQCRVCSSGKATLCPRPAAPGVGCQARRPYFMCAAASRISSMPLEAPLSKGAPYGARCAQGLVAGCAGR